MIFSIFVMILLPEGSLGQNICLGFHAQKKKKKDRYIDFFNTSNPCFHILLNSWENIYLPCFSPCHMSMHQHCNTIPSLIVFQSKIKVTKLLMKSLSAKICHKNVRHEAKLVSIFSRNLFCKKQTCLQHFQCSGDRFAQFVKAGKGIDLKLYNIMLNIWIRTLGKS